jgi:hypothetical protein
MDSKRTLATIAAAVVVAVTNAPAYADDSTAASTQASNAAFAGSGMIVDGSTGLIRAGAAFVVAGITATTDASILVLRDVGTGSMTTVRAASDLVQGGSLAVGQSMQAVAEATGTSLIAGGRVIAFLPNEAGRALVYAARSTQM